jgi:hypothetical protein
MELQVRTVIVAAGRPHPYDRAEWRDALVLVARGEIEVEAVGGERRRFRRGDVLALAGLPLRTLRTPGAADTVLVAVSRLERPADA